MWEGSEEIKWKGCKNNEEENAEQNQGNVYKGTFEGIS